MFLVPKNPHRVLLLFMACAGALLPLNAIAASCNTQSQMTPAQRDDIAGSARTLVAQMQSGDMGALRANTIPAAAADFSGIASSVQDLRPLVQGATITVNSLYLLDASTDPAGSSQTNFYCGTPVVVMNLTNLPPGIYALVILHATGVPKPQQISVILSKTSGGRWMMGGFFDKPMTVAGHDGLWYWTSARQYAQQKMNWNAWFYYRTAANFLPPVEFLSSPNLDKLQHEEDLVHPANLPGTSPMTLNAHGSAFQVTAIDTTATFGDLDLELHYAPDAAQSAQLLDPSAARKQVTDIMAALVALHPELQGAFHGIWVHADRGTASLFSLELPMNAIAAAPQL